jgi:PPM family protein phosphatase
VINFFQKFFRPKKIVEPLTKPIKSGVETAPLSEEQLQAVTKVKVVMHPSQLLIGTGTTIGKQRDHNEDALVVNCGILSDGAREQTFGIFVVADGMGGYELGEVASSLAARTFAEYVLNKLYAPLLGAGSLSLEDSILEIMENAVKVANRAVLSGAPGGGTTLTAALLVGEQVTIAHVGDSRAYFIHPDGRMQQLTNDHSLVQRLIEMGQLSREEAMVHPQRNVLYRALGQSEPFRPDINTFQLPHPGSLLLASDGLWGLVTDTEVFNIVNTSKNPSVACHELCAAADAAGGPDNSTVILVEYLT